MAHFVVMTSLIFIVVLCVYITDAEALVFYLRSISSTLGFDRVSYWKYEAGRDAPWLTDLTDTATVEPSESRSVKAIGA